MEEDEKFMDNFITDFWGKNPLHLIKHILRRFVKETVTNSNKLKVIHQNLNELEFKEGWK